MIKTLILSGGGLGGILSLGCIKFLMEKNFLKNIDCIWGTSIGSFFGLLICLDYSYQEILDMVLLLDLKLLYNFNEDNFFDIFQNYGIDDGNKIKIVVKNVIKNKVGNILITFKELYDLCGIELNINTTCLDDLKTIIFNYKTYPDTPIIDVCLNSMRIPLFYFGNKFHNKYHCDGFLLDNCCINFVENIDNALGIMICNDFNEKKINTFTDYMEQIVKCLYMRQEKLIIEKYDKYLIKLKTNLNIDFDIDNEIKLKLINDGYEKIIEYFENNKNRFKRKYKKKNKIL